MNKTQRAHAPSRIMLDAGGTDGATNRAYSSMFDAALAWAGVGTGQTPQHKLQGGSIGSFGRHIVKTGIFPAEFGRALKPSFPPIAKLKHYFSTDEVIRVPVVDRLSRDTNNRLVINRDMEHAGAGLRSLAEPVVDTTSDFAELVLAILGVAAKPERRRIIERRHEARPTRGSET